MPTRTDKRRVTDLLGEAGTTYAQEAGIRLVDIARTVEQDYADDLRELAVRSDRNISDVKRKLKEFKGIGDTGADIFLREVQDVWTWVRPYFDKRAMTAAADLGLPSDVDRLGAMSPRTNARLAAALVRVSLDDELRDRVRRRR